MATKIIDAIFKATVALEFLRKCGLISCKDTLIFLRLLTHKLRGVRTFILCLHFTSFTYPNVETEGNSDSGSSQVESLLKRLECFLERIYTEANSYLGVPNATDYFDYSWSIEVLVNIESLEEEIDRWYISLELASNRPIRANEVKGIFNSVVENLNDFLSHHIAYVGAVVAPVEALKVNITFWKYFLHFATFLGTDQQQEFQDLLRNMEALAFSAAHFTLHIFSANYYNIQVLACPDGDYSLTIDALHGLQLCETCYDTIKAAVSALLFRINPLDNPRLHKSYTRALVSMKWSRELCVRILDIQEISALLLSFLWEALQFPSGLTLALKNKLPELYEGVTCLRGLLEKHSNKFDGEVELMTSSGIFDVGVMIFSVYQNQDSIVHGVDDFLGMIKVIQTEVGGQVVDTSKFKVQKTTVLDNLDFLLDSLMEVKSSNIDFARPFREDLLFLRSFMVKLVKLRNQLKDDLHEAVWNFGVEVANKIGLLIKRLMLGDIQDSDLMMSLEVTEDMKNIKTYSEKIFALEVTRTDTADQISALEQVQGSIPSSDEFVGFEDERKSLIKTDSEKIFDKVPLEVTRTDTADQISTFEQGQRSIPSSDEFVGFDDERKLIINRLTYGSKKLQVVAIVGMPGLGKTTLATKVYNEPSVRQHFHVRAKCSFSQEFNKRKILLELLNQTTGLKSDKDSSKMTEDDLANQLRRSLLRRRYLIYIDDVWEFEAFQSFNLTFPDDSFGRILLTSRIGDVAKLDDQPLFLRQLTSSESLELLQMKASLGKDWPQPLYDIAVKIVKNCKGLPLSITIVAGLLASTKQEVWEQVLGSLTISSTELYKFCERTIELSYKHLPKHLKPCLLSFGAFPEDEEISVKRLIWLWIAEGFVHKTDDCIVEDVAADYLKDLIGRSLVMNGQKRNGGGIKTCRIHDLLLVFCQRKANEENFLHLINGKQLEKVLINEESRNMRRICVHGKMDDFIEPKFFCPRLRSLTFFCEEGRRDHGLEEAFNFRWDHLPWRFTFIFRIFKLLKVLNMERLRIPSYHFPGEIGNLVRLRYLTITITIPVISPSIGNLCFLETLILDTDYKIVTMPHTFWNLPNLRHLYSYRDEFDLHGIVLPVDEVDNFSNMLKLDSLSGLYSEDWGDMEKILSKFPNIRRLKFFLNEFGNDHVNGSKAVSFSFLSQLESLSLSFDWNSTEFDQFIFPESLKKLNLSNSNLSWEKISRIAELPNLEVLKLHSRCFIGDKWQMEEGEFPKLRFLKLKGLDMINWTGCDDQFPNLEKLVVERCDELKEIPECLENVGTLERIEVLNCSDRVACLFETVADYLKDGGNSVLQFHVGKVPTSEPGSADEEEDDEDEDDEDDDATDEEEDDEDDDDATDEEEDDEDEDA